MRICWRGQLRRSRKCCSSSASRSTRPCSSSTWTRGPWIPIRSTTPIFSGRCRLTIVVNGNRLSSAEKSRFLSRSAAPCWRHRLPQGDNSGPMSPTERVMRRYVEHGPAKTLAMLRNGSGIAWGLERIGIRWRLVVDHLRGGPRQNAVRDPKVRLH